VRAHEKEREREREEALLRETFRESSRANPRTCFCIDVLCRVEVQDRPLDRLHGNTRAGGRDRDIKNGDARRKEGPRPVCTSVGIIRVQECHGESVSEDNDQSPIRFRRAFSFANPVRAKLNLAVAKSTNFIDLASVEDEPKRERERQRVRERERERERETDRQREREREREKVHARAGTRRVRKVPRKRGPGPWVKCQSSWSIVGRRPGAKGPGSGTT